jgi:hypothetical protein
MDLRVPAGDAVKALSIELGALAPTIEEQLAAQGFRVITHPERFQRWSDAITRLSIAGLLTETETRRSRRRLLAMIGSEARRVTPEATS